MRIALAQLPVRVGDVDGNAGRIIEAAAQAADAGADLLLCPELALIGYPPDDLLLRQGLPVAVADALARLTAARPDIGMVVGYPEFTGGQVYNAAAVLRGGACIANYRKQRLPNYGVFDEKRHFAAGEGAVVFEHAGLRLGLSICEDLWDPGPVAAAKAAGAQLLLNLNASPFDRRKRAQRRAVLAQRAAETGLPMVYVNTVGGQDEILFDGDSQVLDGGATPVFCSRPFVSGLGLVDVDADGRPRAVPAVAPAAPPLQDSCAAAEAAEASDAVVYQALVTGIADYVNRNGFERAYIGLSGGIDSALTVALAADALGPERVYAVAMPSRYSAEISAADADAQSRLLGVHYSCVPIEPGFRAMLEMLAPAFGDLPADIAEENMQSRLRGGLLMALSNKFRGIVLATGNKSEMAVGYATLYGDMCGGYAPLKDVYKTEVYALARYRNSLGAAIPERVITRPPSAELRPDQLDEDSLPPYERLDPILRAYIEQQWSIPRIVADGHDEAEVRRVVGLVRGAEYKRRQAAPGPKVSVCAFGRERRLPITAVYGEF